MIKLKRMYEEPSPTDGLRILVERLWPRGLRKEDADLDLWLKDVAPSAELRRWYGHEPSRWHAFRKRYWQELGAKREAVAFLRRKCEEGTVTFLYAARDTARNSAVALKAYLDENGHSAA